MLKPGRRASDRWTHRAVMGLALLACLIGMLSAFVGYRAIRVSLLAMETMETYNATLEQVLRQRYRKPMNNF